MDHRQFGLDGEENEDPNSPVNFAVITEEQEDPDGMEASRETENVQSTSESLSDSDPTTSNETENPIARSHDSNDIEDEGDEQTRVLMTANEQVTELQINGEAAADCESLVQRASVQTVSKRKGKRKNNSNNIWVKRSSRKGRKRAKNNVQNNVAEDKVMIMPVPRYFDRSDDAPEEKICLSKVCKAEKVELSEDRLMAGSAKGYRMVRATRGVGEGAWYFEIRVMRLGETGHTRLGWSTEKGDLQAPVGYDGHSFGYRDIDGSKVHKALREKYGDEGYVEGDVIGFYINLPEGRLYAPKPPRLVWYKGQRYICAPDLKEDPPKIVPGSMIIFFKNGESQGVAYKDLYGGQYYPAASMYTLPNQPNCEVKFNFGPEFEFFPKEFEGHPIPKPMVEVPYHGFDYCVENGASTV